MSRKTHTDTPALCSSTTASSSTVVLVLVVLVVSSYFEFLVSLTDSVLTDPVVSSFLVPKYLWILRQWDRARLLIPADL